MTEGTSGVGELIQQLKEDGVSAGEEERRKIVDAAREEAEQIVAAARRQSEVLRAEAEAAAESLRSQLDAELRLVARDFVSTFQHRIRQQIVAPTVARETRRVVASPGFLEGTIRELCLGYFSSGGKSLQVTVPESQRERLEAFFAESLRSDLAGGDVTVRGEEDLEGFRLTPSGESFSWDFTTETIARELQALVEPSLRRYFALDAAASS